MLNNINQMMDAWRHHQWYIDGYGCDFNEFEQDSDDDRIPRNIPPSKQCKIEEWTKWNQCGCNGYCLVHFNELEKGSNDHRKTPSRKCKIKKCNKWNPTQTQTQSTPRKHKSCVGPFQNSCTHDSNSEAFLNDHTCDSNNESQCSLLNNLKVYTIHFSPLTCKW